MECLAFAKYQTKLDQSFYFSHFTGYTNSSNTVYGNLNMSHKNFNNYILQLDTIFLNNFRRVIVENNVRQKLKDYIINVPFSHPCNQFELIFLINLYTGFRIFNVINDHNKSLMSDKKFKNYKLTIVTHL